MEGRPPGRVKGGLNAGFVWGSSLDSLFPVGRNTGRGVFGHGVGVIRVMVVAAGG